MKIKFGRISFELVDKERKQPVRRLNGQIARKIPVTINGKLVEYIYR